MSPAEAILSRLQGVKSRGAGRWMTLCPAHRDKTASLSIVEGADGRLLLKCFAGCEVTAVLRAIALDVSDLFPEGSAHRLRPSTTARLLGGADALRLLRQEALIAAVSASDLAQGKMLTRVAKDRLMLAAGRIAQVYDEVRP